ncbi:hypothetical protein DPEC_G00305150 [Dallia pectoralis]|uniref:Uncharacterized protein n=1 Tax=Dallia pectoralis TaxID=75939 RepID=A0ACC2FDQ4_DALPE|nr:hypothetical protein DPEC_G00305150 [Dallia pectoralis]
MMKLRSVGPVGLYPTRAAHVLAWLWCSSEPEVAGGDGGLTGSRWRPVNKSGAAGETWSASNCCATEASMADAQSSDSPATAGPHPPSCFVPLLSSLCSNLPTHPSHGTTEGPSAMGSLKVTTCRKPPLPPARADV